MSDGTAIMGGIGLGLNGGLERTGKGWTMDGVKKKDQETDWRRTCKVEKGEEKLRLRLWLISRV
jgi:hypothetical protein